MISFNRLLALAVVGTTVALGSFATPAFAGHYTAPSIDVTRDGRYIYYKVAFGKLDAEDTKEIIDSSVQLLQNEIQSRLANVPAIHTLSNFLLQPKVLDDITALAQQSVTVADSHTFRGYVPTAILITGGGELSVAWLGKVGGSADLGLVVHVSKVVRVDTTNWSREAYYKVDTSWVAIPRGTLGLGAGGSGSARAGFGVIWGDMTSARDFNGAIIAPGADFKFGAGITGTGGIVDNPFTHKGFLLGQVEISGGASAIASAQLDLGMVITLDDALKYLQTKINFSNLLNIPTANTTIGTGDQKAPDDKSVPSTPAPNAPAPTVPVAPAPNTPVSVKPVGK